MVEPDTGAVMGAKMLPICHGVAAEVSGDEGFYGRVRWVERKGALDEGLGGRKGGGGGVKESGERKELERKCVNAERKCKWG